MNKIFTLALILCSSVAMSQGYADSKCQNIPIPGNYKDKCSSCKLVEKKNKKRLQQSQYILSAKCTADNGVTETIKLTCEQDPRDSKIEMKFDAKNRTAGLHYIYGACISR